MWWFPINIGYRRDAENESTMFWSKPEWILIDHDDTVQAILFELEGRNNLPAGRVEMRLYTEAAYSIMKPTHFIWQHIEVMERLIDPEEPMWFVAIYEYRGNLSRMDQRHAGAA